MSADRAPAVHRVAGIAAVATLAALAAWATRAPHLARAAAPAERIAAPAACYVRLPDLPAPRYGGFGATNPDTAVVAYAGGASKLKTGDTVVHSDLYAIRLDGLSAAWRALPAGQAGYNRARDRGCRAMASVPMTADRWLSVFGKDGCDNGRIDRGKRGGDIRALRIGAAADAASVRWSIDVKLAGLPNLLAAKKGRLMEPFAAWDARRSRLVFGQGTFGDDRPEDTRGETYVATQIGAKLQIREVKPQGPVPSRRWGSCGAYVSAPQLGLDGVLVVGGQAPGVDAPMHAEVWWLDFAARDSGTWHDVTPRIAHQADFGPRRSGACAFDTTTSSVYWWMGRASKDIPDGAKRSGGLWRLDLTGLADPSAPLAWERLAADDLDGFTGRHDIPSIWDPVRRRMLVLGGRNGDDVLSDAWAIYPGVDPAACDRVDPFAAPPTDAAPSVTGEGAAIAPQPGDPGAGAAAEADGRPTAPHHVYLPHVRTNWRPSMGPAWPGAATGGAIR